MPAVQFAGEEFTTTGTVPMFALMRLAKVAKAGIDTNTMEGLAALYEMLEQLVAPEDWNRFQTAAMRARATDKDLVEFLGDVYSKTKSSVAPAEPAAVGAPAPMWD